MNIQNSLKFLLPLVLGSFLNLNAQQSVLSSFNGYADIVNVVQDPDATGADSVFTLQINNFAGSPRFQPFGPWIAADVQVGCVVWVDCSRLVIKEVIYASYSSMEVKVTVPQPDWLLGVSVPLINTRCAVVYEDQYLLTALPAPADGNAGALSGINNSLFACMLNHYSQALLTTKNSVNEITDYVAGLDTVPSESPIPNLGETWRNSVGQLFYSDGTQWLTDKEVLFTNYGLEGLPSNLYKLGLDTLGQDTLYVSNNGIFNRFQAGLVYKEGFGINIYATDSIEVDTNQIATQYDLSQIEIEIDTFRVSGGNVQLSLKNDNAPVKTIPVTDIAPTQTIVAGTGISVSSAPNVTVTNTGDLSNTNEIQSLSTNGTAGNISISSGNTITLNVNDADASTTNELQQVDTFRVNSTNLELSLTSDNQSVRTVPLSSIVTSGGGLTGNGVVNYLSQYNSTSTLDTTGIIWVGGRMGIGTNAPTDQLHTTGSVRLQNYPNTLNSTGNPVNVLSTSSTGVVESHPASDLLANTGGCAMPVNASFGGIASGAIEITLPNLVTGYAWISFEVDVLTTTTTIQSQKFKINIYCDLAEGGTPTIFNQSTVYVVGGQPRYTSNVRLGRAGNNIKVWIDELNTNWNSLVVKVHDVSIEKVTSGTQVNPASICSGWSISLESTSFDVVQQTRSITYQPSRLSAKVDNPANLDFLIDEKQWLGGNYIGTFTGAIQINLPDSTLIPSASTDIKMHFSIYFTASSVANIRRVDVLTSYNYVTRGWGSSHVTTTDGAWNNLTFRFGREGTVPVIYIGELNSSFTGFGIALRGLVTFDVQDAQHNALVQYPWSATTETAAFSNVNSTRTITATSSGAIPFTSTLGYRFNDNLFWDNTNARLGVGNTTPLARLQVSGSSALSADRAVLVTDNASTPLNLFEIRNNGDIYFNDYPNTLNTTGNPVNVLSTGADGVLQSHPISEVISSGGAITSILGGTGISVSTVSGTSTITNTAPDQTVSITGAGINTVTGTYPNFTITGTEVDGSTTNELQTLSAGTNSLTLSNGGGTVTVDTDPTNDVTGSGASGQVSYWSGTQTQTGSSSLIYNDTQKSLTLTNSTQSGTPRGWLMQQTTGDGAGNLFIMQKSRAGAITSGTTIGVWDAEGFDGSAYQKSSRITFTSSGTIGAGAVPGTISFVTANSSGTLTTRTTLDHLGVFNHLGSAAIGASFAPAANLHVRGSGSTSSTWTAQFHNNAGNNNALMIRDDGRVGIGTSTLSNILTIAGSAAIPRIYIEAPDNTESATILFDAKRPAGNPIFSFTNQGRFIIGNGIGFYATSGGPSAPILRSGSGIFVGDAGAFDNTSANGMVVLGKPNNFARITTGVGSTASTVELIGTHSPTSTNIRYNMLSIIPVYNQTGTADGAFVGIDYNPTIESLLGRHYAATFRSGSVGIGTSAPNASAALDVTSTTQGVLFPRMTTTQRNAITSPAAGLTIYNTTDGVMQHYNGSTWTDERDNVNGLSGLGVTNYLAQYNSSNTLDTTGVIWTGGRLGIGTATPSTRLDVQAISDAALVGSTDLASGFSSTVVGSWVFDAVNSRWDHITGNTNTLTANVTNISSATQIYRATVTIVNRTAGSIRLSLKGSSWPVALTGTSTIYFEQVNTANNLVVTPTSDFNGSVSIVINSITQMPATTSLKNTSGAVVYEERATSSSYNVIQGVNAGMFSVSGNGRIYIGRSAGKNSVTSGNIAIGTEAGMSNYTGGGWAAIGGQAGTANISGINWYAIGAGAGQANISGNNWFAIGTNSARFNRTGSSFVAIGERAAYVDTTASAFIAIGNSAAFNHLAGSAFTAIGAEAAAYYTGAGFTSATDFSNGVYIGYQTRVGVAGAANETVIGYQALGLGTNTTRIGNSNTIQTHLDGRLTIGNTFYDSRVAARIVGANVLSTEYSLVVTNSNGATSTNTNGSLVVTNDGKVGVGTYSPNRTLQVTGEARITDLTTDTPTKIVGADADGDLGEISLGSGLSITSGVLNTSSTLNTGSGTAGQVTFWNGTNSITGDNTFTWNNTNGLIVGGIQYNGYGTSLSTTGVGFSTAGSNRTLTMQSGNNNNASDVTGISINSGTLINRTASTSFRGTTFTGQLQSGTTNLTSFTALYSSYNPKYALTTFIGYDYDPLFTVDPTNHYAALFRSGLVGIGLSAPTARLHVVGTSTASGTNALLVQNVTPTTLFSVENNGVINIANSGADIRPVSVSGSVDLTGPAILFNSTKEVNSNDRGNYIFDGNTMQPTSGFYNIVSILRPFWPSSGSAQYRGLSITPNINQTGTATGSTRGILISPTLTSAPNWRSIEWSNNIGYGLYGSGTAPNLLNGILSVPMGTYDAPSLTFNNDLNTGIYSPLADNLEIKTGTNNAVVLENQSTNVKTYSENLTTGWVYQNITLSIPGNVSAPDGTTTANLAVPNTTLAQHRMYYLISIAEPYTLSVYAKSAGYNFISFGQSGGVGGQSFIFDIVNGTISGSETGYSAQIENVGNGWFRCSLTRTPTAAAANVSRWIIVRNSNSNADYAGDGTSGVYLWGHQLETGLGASSYVRTDATTVTRPQAVSVLGPNIYGTLLTRTLGSQSFQDLSFTTQNATRMTITNSGSVGIGTATPSRTLHVVGEVRITDLSTDTPTKLVGADADGDLDDVVLGEGLTLSSGVLDVSSSAAVLASEVVIEGSTATTIDLDVSGNVKTIDGGNATFVYPSNLARLSVYKNGVRLTRSGSPSPARDFTVNTTTNEITFSTPLVSTDRIVIVKL